MKKNTIVNDKELSLDDMDSFNSFLKSCSPAPFYFDPEKVPKDIEYQWFNPYDIKKFRVNDDCDDLFIYGKIWKRGPDDRYGNKKEIKSPQLYEHKKED